MSNFINPYDISTEQVIVAHGYEPALVRRTKEAKKANKYKSSNPKLEDDARYYGKWKYRDYVGAFNRWNYKDLSDDALYARDRAKNPMPSKAQLYELLAEEAIIDEEPITYEPMPEPKLSPMERIELFVDRREEDGTIWLILGALVSVLLVLVYELISIW